MPRLRTAILGCGGIAERHARVLTQLPEDIELVAFSDFNGSRAVDFSERHTGGSARAFTRHDHMLAEAELDLLVICLPPFGHSDEVELAAARGVHLLIEKPIALDSEQAWRMVHAAEQAGIKTQVGFMSRFGEAVEQLKRQIESGEAGQIGLFNARYACNALHAPWWREREKSGGQLVEQAIHQFDLMRYLVGEPVSVFSRQTNFFHKDIPGYTSEDTSVTVTSFANGALGSVQATNGAIPRRWIKEFHVAAQCLTADFTDENHATFYDTAQPEVTSRAVESSKDVFELQMRDLIAAIRTGGETRTPIREGAKTLDLVLAARKSAEERRELELPIS
jgi:predicted dehydrogenase